MKKHLLLLLLGSIFILLSVCQNAAAQDEKKSKVHITITEDDKVTTDTTFELAEGQDPEMIKKVVSHMAGGDLHEKHMYKEAHMSHGESDKMVWVHSDGDKVWHEEHAMEGINVDSIKEAHKDAKVLIIKNKDGDVTVKELDEFEDHEMHLGDDEHGEHYEMMFIDSDDEEGMKQIIIHTDVDDCEGKEKKVKVIVHVDEDMEWTEGGEENVEVYIIKGDDGETKKIVKKKIKVEIEDDEESESGEETVKEKKTQKKK